MPLLLFPDRLLKVKTTFPMRTHRCRRRGFCRHSAPFIFTSAREPLPFFSAARGGKMAVQISKKRKVRHWTPSPGDYSAARVRCFLRCRCETCSSVHYPRKWLGLRGILAGRGWRWIECGARAGRAQCGGGRVRRFLSVPSGKQR